MRFLVVQPPAPVLTWDEARAHLRLEADDERQPYVMSLVDAVTSSLDGPSGWLGRAIGSQQIEALLDADDATGQRVRLMPSVIDLVSVKYLDAAGAEQTADLGKFYVAGNDLMPGSASWAWVGGLLKPDTIRIRYLAGFEVVPAPIKVAIGMMMRSLYERADIADAVTGPAASLLQGYRVWR